MDGWIPVHKSDLIYESHWGRYGGRSCESFPSRTHIESMPLPGEANELYYELCVDPFLFAGTPIVNQRS